MAAVLLACLAAACFGALAIVVRTGLRRSPDTELAPFTISLAAGVLVAAVAAASGSFDELDLGAVWPFAAIGAGVPGLSQILFVRAIRDAGASRAMVLIGTTPVISATLAVAFLDEPLRPALAIATALIVVGGAALAWEQERPAGFRIAGAVLALTCAGLFAVRDNLVRHVAVSDEVAPLAATTASLAGAVLGLVLYLVLRRRRRALSGFAVSLRAFLPAAFFLALAYGALLAAFDRGAVTVVAPLNATQSLWGLAIAAAVLGREEAIGGRLVAGAALVVAGGAIVGAFQ
jgi:drug/metabolite transporter (DMT)-like permease